MYSCSLVSKHFHSNFRAIILLENLATQATQILHRIQVGVKKK